MKPRVLKFALLAGAAVVCGLSWLLLHASDASRRAQSPEHHDAEQAPTSVDIEPGPGDLEAVTEVDGGQGSVSVDAESVRRLLAEPDEGAWRERLVQYLRAKGGSDRISGGVLTAPEGHFHVLNGLLQAPEEYGVLTAEEGRITRKWDFLQRVLAHFSQKDISEEDKLRIGKQFLESCGVLSRHELEALTDSAEVALAMQSFGDAISEAREIRSILGEGLTEEQARRIAIALRGLVIGQRRVESLARGALRVDLSPSGAAALERAFLAQAEKKRGWLTKALSPAQASKLYEKLQYDSLGYWKRRLSTE